MLVAELNMPGVQQEKTIHALLNYNEREKNGISMVLVTPKKTCATITTARVNPRCNWWPGR
jgi:hypothetical protein